MDTKDLRQVFGRFATGITVITTRTPEGEDYGVTINSFASVSLEPPLVSFALQRGSPMGGHIRRAGGYAVNILSADQQELSNHFASDEHRQPFTNWPLLPKSASQPLLADCLAALECRLWQEYDGGDHVLLLAEVLDCQAFEGQPLLYYRSRYATL